MIALKIKQDPQSVAEKLGTGKALHIGQVFAMGSEDSMKDFAKKYPKLVELVDPEKLHAPKTRKMLKKTPRVKTK